MTSRTMSPLVSPYTDPTVAGAAGFLCGRALIWLDARRQAMDQAQREPDASRTMDSYRIAGQDLAEAAERFSAALAGCQECRRG